MFVLCSTKDSWKYLSQNNCFKEKKFKNSNYNLKIFKSKSIIILCLA